MEWCRTCCNSRFILLWLGFLRLIPCISAPVNASCLFRCCFDRNSDFDSTFHLFYFQVDVERPAFQESTSLGAALAAGLAVGMWGEEFIFSQTQENKATFTPQNAAEDTERRYVHWKTAVGRSLDLASLAQ